MLNIKSSTQKDICSRFPIENVKGMQSNYIYVNRCFFHNIIRVIFERIKKKNRLKKIIRKKCKKEKTVEFDHKRA